MERNLKLVNVVFSCSSYPFVEICSDSWDASQMLSSCTSWSKMASAAVHWWRACDSRRLDPGQGKWRERERENETSKASSGDGNESPSPGWSGSYSPLTCWRILLLPRNRDWRRGLTLTGNKRSTLNKQTNFSCPSRCIVYATEKRSGVYLDKHCLIGLIGLPSLPRALMTGVCLRDFRLSKSVGPFLKIPVSTQILLIQYNHRGRLRIPFTSLLLELSTFKTSCDPTDLTCDQMATGGW